MIKNKTTRMNASFKIDLLNFEGPFLILQKIKDHWSFKFHNNRIELITNTREILDFISGKKPLVNEGKLHFFNSYSHEAKPKEDKMLDLVNRLLREEMERCKTDKEYFFNTYCKISKNEEN
jgi:hypothetical protein